MKKWKLIVGIALVLFICGLVVYKFAFQDPIIQPNTPMATSTQTTGNPGKVPLPRLGEIILGYAPSTIFADAIKTFGYDKLLNQEGQYTVFVPTDAAYQNLPPETAVALATYEQEDAFRSVIAYHIVKGLYQTKDFKDGMTLETLQGENITITRHDGFWAVNGYAAIETPDIGSSNGTMHTTTNFIFPPTFVSSPETQINDE